MNKFAEWMKKNDKKQCGVAEKIGISQSSLHDILKKNIMPNLRVAYAIEQYTRGVVTVYDWIDQNPEQDKTITKTNTTTKEKKKKP